MGKRGPKKMPDAVKQFRGNPGKRPLNDQSPVATGKARMPSWMTPAAKAVWKRIVPHLEEMKVLASIDTDSLARYCTYVVLWRQAFEDVKTSGPVSTTHNGCRIANPAVGAMNSYDKTCRDYEARFGMDPSSRSSMRLETPKADENPLESLKLAM